MKKILLILLSAFVAFGASAQEAKPKIAVYTSKVQEISTLSPLTSQIIKSLLSDYEVVGRAGEFQQLIDKEFNYQSSGKVDDKQLAKRGQQFGVDYICAVVVHKFSQLYYFEARIISVENANVVGIADMDTNKEPSPSVLMSIGKALVADLANEVKAYDARQAKKSIAVYTNTLDGVSTFSPMISRIIRELLTDYEVVARSGDFQTLIDDEFVHQGNGNVADSQLSKSGKQYGVDYICAVVVNEFKLSAGTEYYFEARIISVENANVTSLSDVNVSFKLSLKKQRQIGTQLGKGLKGEEIPTTGTENGHSWVDLGLPSGLKWATCNVGAWSPVGYGDYYAWGELDTKSKYRENNCSTFGKSIGDISGKSKYDVARAKWGGSWRMPTKSDFQELIENCTLERTTQSGYKGYKVTGPNGNSIFLPAAGYRKGADTIGAESLGSYWCATSDMSGMQTAYVLTFGSGDRRELLYYRYCGRSVRPVSE